MIGLIPFVLEFNHYFVAFTSPREYEEARHYEDARPFEENTVEEISGLGDRAYLVRRPKMLAWNVYVLKRGDFQLQVTGENRDGVLGYGREALLEVPNPSAEPSSDQQAGSIALVSDD